jgi:hypothetical protein
VEAGDAVPCEAPEATRQAGGILIHMLPRLIQTYTGSILRESPGSRWKPDAVAAAAQAKGLSTATMLANTLGPAAMISPLFR